MTDSDPTIEGDIEPDDEPDDDGPRFNKRQIRVQIALAKYYGLGNDSDGWGIERIAEYLNCSERTIERYIFDSELSEKVEEQLAETQARTRMKLAMKLLDRLDELEELIDERKQVKEPAVASHKQMTVEGEVTMNRDGMRVGGENAETTDFTLPVPDHFVEVTKISREMETLLREWRSTVQEIEDLLGLEAPDKIEEERREVSVEGRVFEGIDAGSFPAADAELEGTEIDLEETE